MTTSALIEHLKLGLNPNFRYTERYVFVQIDTGINSANHTPISVFVTNNLPQNIIVSDSSWIAENKYFDFTLLSFETQKELLQKWNLKLLSEESSKFHVHKSTELSSLYAAINDMIQYIVECGNDINTLKERG